ncbi:VOC family protein [Listeria booriae]|uniref:VOC family protein n=1 Tax=Listeria booriae TaxID=1552123 RepID=A0A841ZXK1_9LIST|nr:VOC family protein [Listeria booriae]MBC1564403.1 VOC family protein [Listeria booriae]MBC2162918.1 VOC family protein [Listeria booriae]
MTAVFLHFTGNCREALDYYGSIFEVEPKDVATYGDAPSNSDESANRDQIMYSEIDVRGLRVMLSDMPDGIPATVGDNVSIVIESDDLEDLQAMYAKFEADSKIYMPLEATFWSKGYAMIADKFGVQWHFSYAEFLNVSS